MTLLRGLKEKGGVVLKQKKSLWHLISLRKGGKKALEWKKKPYEDMKGERFNRIPREW